MKRSDYITWDQYFMGIAIMSANRSKDPNTQVGACIVDQDNRILTVGYNGMPSGCNDDEMPWDREGEGMASKYFFVCHAELNAILNYRGGGTLRGTILYMEICSAVWNFALQKTARMIPKPCKNCETAKPCAS